MPSNMMEQVLLIWHHNMGPEIESEFIHAIRRFSTIVPDGIMQRWSLFVGSGLSSKFYQALGQVWHRLYGVQIGCDCNLYCEMNEHKQEHIIKTIK